MGRYLFIVSVVLVIFLSVSAKNDYREYNLAAFEAQNKARTDPKYFAQLAKNQLENQFVYGKDKKPTTTMCLSKYFEPKSQICYNSLETVEGPKAWNDAVADLSSMTGSLKPLKWSEGLAQACYDHIRDIGPKGLTGHTGSDNSSPFARIKKYTINQGVGENVAFSDVDKPEDAILQLIVDDGVFSRGHRRNIMKPEFTHGGVSWGCHNEYTEVCWFAYGIDVEERNPGLISESAPQLKECKEYTSKTEGNTNSSFHLKKDDPKQNIKGIATNSTQTSQANTQNKVKPNQVIRFFLYKFKLIYQV